MKRYSGFWGGLMLVLLLVSPGARAQSPQTPALQYAFAQAVSDTSRVLLLADLSASYRYSRLDSVLIYARQGLALARQLRYGKGEGRCLARLAMLQAERGNLSQALRINLQALKLNEASRDAEGTARTLNQIGLLHQALDDHRLALQYYFRAWKIYRHVRTHDTSQLVSVLANIGSTYTGMQKLDSARYFLERCEAEVLRETPGRWSSWGNPEPYVLRELGLLAAARSNPRQALGYYRRSAQAAVPENDRRSACRAFQYLAELYREEQQLDSSIYYARRALVMGRKLPYVVGIMHTSQLLADAFGQRQQADSALRYLRIMQTAEDSLYNPLRLKQLDAIALADVQRQQRITQQQQAEKVRFYIYLMLAVMGGLLIITLLQARYNRQQHRTNLQLQQLNNQVTEQTGTLTTQRDELTTMLLELKTTQDQLVMRDRMASLGELMAGVAYELQQPAQAIENMAGISQQLCEELTEFLPTLPLPSDAEQTLRDMAGSLCKYQQNLRRHGERVSLVVRNMREYAGQEPNFRQLTGVNELAENYLYLTYHDLRAKHPAFAADLVLDFDEAAGAVEMVRHDVGRALISVFLNAFQAVLERSQQPAAEAYQPTITVASRRLADAVELRVGDNGLGIPVAAQERLFERFFSTRASQAAPGLGLALSREIIAGAHGGALSVSSVPGTGTEVTIQLPLTTPLPGVTPPR